MTISKYRRIGQAENDGVLDKEAISYADVFDAFRLALHFYRLGESIIR